MKNETVTLSGEPVAWVSPDVTNFSEGERQWVKIPASLVEDRTSGHTVPLYAALAEPVPPAGGEVEVLGYQVTRITPTGNARLDRPLLSKVLDGWEPAFKVVELVDRAHVTRLQAEVERLKAEAGIYRTGYALLKEELTKAQECLKDRGVDMYRSAPPAKDESHDE